MRTQGERETYRVATLPDPGQASTLDDRVERLRLLKIWAPDPSYESIKDRVNAAWAAAGRPPGELAGKTIVVDCLRSGRRRLRPDLVVAIVHALHPDPAYVAQWRQALRSSVGRPRRPCRSGSKTRFRRSWPNSPAAPPNWNGCAGRWRTAVSP